MDVAEVLSMQAGIISRRQALEGGLTQHDVRRLLRRRTWVSVHPGVYVDHTGPLSWQQRTWAAVQHAWPSALSHRSSLMAAGLLDRDDGAVHVAVARGRHLVTVPGIVLHRTSGFTERVQWNASPPRTRLEEAVLDCAVTARTDLDAIAMLADACGSRRTTASRIRLALDGRRRTPRRAFLARVLDDVAAGTCSVLEHRYLDLVERPHRLPQGERQAEERSDGGRRMFRDVRYPDGTVVELDGRLRHDTASARDRDLDRDLDVAASGRRTVRLGYGQVLGRPCRTAARLARILGAGGPCAQCG